MGPFPTAGANFVPKFSSISEYHSGTLVLPFKLNQFQLLELISFSFFSISEFLSDFKVLGEIQAGPFPAP